MEPVDFVIETLQKAGIVPEEVRIVGNIRVDIRTRWKCRFGCEYFGRRYSCPPNVPENFEEFVISYKKALVIVYRFEDYFVDKKKMQEILPEIETKLLREYPLAFALFPGGCDLCEECSYEKSRECSRKSKVRPSLSSMGILVSQFGIEIGDGKSVALILLD